MNFLPSPRFSLILLSVFIAGGLVFAVLPGENVEQRISLNEEVFKNKTQSVAALVPVESPALKQAAESDLDGDGLPDWEERLWKTDPNKKDTDGDGTSDGIEVNAGRSPIVKGPKDSIKETVSLAAAYQKDAPIAEQGLSPTDRVAREFFARYLSLKQSGKPLTPKDQQALLVETIELSAKESDPLKEYVLADLSLSENETDEALRVYGNALGEIVRRNSFSTENELSLFANVLETGSASALVGLEKIGKAHDTILRELLALQVPKRVASLHLFLVNRESAVADTIRGLQIVAVDPVSSLVSFANYEERAAGLALAVRDLQIFFSEQGIEFPPSEVGYLFFKTGTGTSI